MSPRSPRRARSLLAVALLTLAGAVGAQPADNTARVAELKAKGDQAMTEQRYADADQAYAAAYDVGGEPRFLYNRGSALFSMGRFAEALEQLEAFDANAPAALKKKVPDLPRFIADVRSRVATINLEVNVPGASVFVDDREVGRIPLTRPLRVNAGPVRVKVVAEGYQAFERALKPSGGSTLDLVVQLSTMGDPKPSGPAPAATAAPVSAPEGATSPTPSPAPGTAPGEDPGQGGGIFSEWWFWTGVGVVVVAGATTFWALGQEKDASKGDLGQVSAPLLRF